MPISFKVMLGEKIYEIIPQPSPNLPYSTPLPVKMSIEPTEIFLFGNI